MLLTKGWLRRAIDNRDDALIRKRNAKIIACQFLELPKIYQLNKWSKPDTP